MLCSAGIKFDENIKFFLEHFKFFLIIANNANFLWGKLTAQIVKHVTNMHTEHRLPDVCYKLDGWLAASLNFM